jgi:hypothetical protein
MVAFELSGVGGFASSSRLVIADRALLLGPVVDGGLPLDS